MIIKPGVTIFKDEEDNIRQAVKRMANRRLTVGVLSDKTDRVDGNITNAALAYIHETGMPSKNIPARPFLVSGIKDVKPNIERYMKRMATAEFDGENDKIRDSLQTIGRIAVAAIKKRISTGTFVPLAESTIEKRKGRGVTTTQPLFDTKQLYRSIGYRITEARNVGI